MNQIASENEELQKILDRAKTDVDSGDAAYKPETLEDLKKELEKAQKLPAELPALIDPFDMMTAPAGFSKKELKKSLNPSPSSNITDMTTEIQTRIINYGIITLLSFSHFLFVPSEAKAMPEGKVV